MDSFVGNEETVSQRAAIGQEARPKGTARPRAYRQGAEVTECASVRQLAPAARYVMRGGPHVMAAAGKALGLEISKAACRAAIAGGTNATAALPNSEPVVTTGLPATGIGRIAALWLGPDEQLWLAPEGNDLTAALAPFLNGLPHSLVDVSHRQMALEISGPHATALLNTGCPLDLDADSFPVGMCTRTVFAKAEVVLWRTGADVFHLEVWRSFAAYVSEFLAEAAREIAR